MCRKRASPLPRRRPGVAGALIGILFPVLPGCGPESRPDHVVLLVLDTTRRDALSCYGGVPGSTPHLDALAADGVRFEQAITTSGWTLPSVASMLTGVLPTIHGGLGRSVVLNPIRDEVPTAAELLGAAGFRTLAVTNAAFVSPLLHLDRGFDVFDHEYTFNQDNRRADRSVDRALELLREAPPGPRFLLIHLFDPHLDYDPPGAYRFRFTGGRTEPPPPLTGADCLRLQEEGPPSAEDAAYVRAVYQGEVAFLDAQVGRFVDALKAQGLYESTTFVVTSDHGEEFWEHGDFEHGHTLYDELVRVPLILKLPDRIPVSRRVVESQVSVVDILPTVLEVAGVEPPDSLAGESLIPLVHRAGPDRPAFCESTLYGHRLVAWRDARYKYIHDLDRGAETGELYDWRADPAELHDLAAERPEVAEARKVELLNRFGVLLKRAGAMSAPEPVDMSPRQIEMLRSLGYVR